MKIAYVAAAIAAALFAVPVAAQSCATHDANGMCVPATLITTMPAASVALTGTVSPSAVTPTSGAATLTGGTATIGPFTPILGRDIALTLNPATGSIFSAQLLDSRDGGTTKLPLTIFDTQIGGPYTVPVNSVITSESVSNRTVWLVVTVTSGSVAYAVEQ